MTIAIMQPYFLPYIGYFQLMHMVDEFVIYDNIEFSKKGWVNRNRILVNGSDSYITIPLKKDSDYLNICDRYLAEVWQEDRSKLLNKIKESYRKSPHFSSVYPLMDAIILYNEGNLFKFLLNSLEVIRDYLKIQTPMTVSSHIAIDHGLKAEKKVIEICKARRADAYVNAIGGLALYDKSEFASQGLKLSFIKTNALSYTQFQGDFVPFLSIIDVMMFNSKEEIRSMLNQFELI